MSKTQNWKAFGGKYLKAEDVANDTDKYVITKVESEDEDGRETVIFTLERNGISKLFGCNVTNEQAVKEANPDAPDQAIGKVVTFFKVKVTNPTTKQLVDGLRICFKKEEVKEEKIESSGVAEDGTM